MDNYTKQLYAVAGIAIVLTFALSFVAYWSGVSNGQKTSASCLGLHEVKLQNGALVYVASPNLLTCSVFKSDEQAWKQCMGIKGVQ